LIEMNLPPEWRKGKGFLRGTAPRF
jgi:hypothetical protein